MTSTRGTVLVLQHAECERPFLIGDVLLGEGFVLQTIRPDLGERVPDRLGGAAGVVIMGGPQGVYETDKFPYLRDEMDLIRRALERECPILGVCLGSQLLAAALGATVSKGAHREIGWHMVRSEHAAQMDPVWRDVPEQFMGFHWHGDVFELPTGSVRLASSHMTQTQAFGYGGVAYGILCHLEATPSSVMGMIDAFPEEVVDAGVDPYRIRQEMDEHMGILQKTGRTVFSRWASLLKREVADKK